MQAVLDTLDLPEGATLVLGGDGRYYNDTAIQLIIRLTAAAGVRHLIVGRAGLLSTPAASNLIRVRGAHGGFLLTASHNPGGPDGDFGIKFNTASGGQAPPRITDAVFAASQKLSRLPYCRAASRRSQPHRRPRRSGPSASRSWTRWTTIFGSWRASSISTSSPAGCAAAIASCSTPCMAITGPYARRILCEMLGASEESLLHAIPLPDFGGLHPDPNPVDAHHLVELCAGPGAPDLVAASDGDGDRNMILGPSFMLSPCDSVAMMLANLTRIRGYRDGVPGVARSLPTSRALDVVASEPRNSVLRDAHGMAVFSATCWKRGASACVAKKVSGLAHRMRGRRTASGRCCSG